MLPQILKELVEARREVKKQRETCTDPVIRTILENRQLALKLSCNSVYGFTGATVGQLPCLAIASSVTAYGRKILDLSQKLI